MRGLPFSSKRGQFYRGNLHTHSTLSDGTKTPKQVCALYRSLGYDFLAITDHFLQQYGYPMTDTRAYRTKDFTTLIGAELHAPRTVNGNLWHILAVGLPLDFAPLGEDEDGPQLAQRAMSSGAFVAIAHPGWYHLTPADALSLGKVDAIEIFNGTSIDHNDAPDGWGLADMLADQGHRYWVCATDDAHITPRRADVATGWVMVKADALEPDALLAALKAGAFYSSTGPEIYDIKFSKNQRLTVRCSPASRVFVTGGGYLARSEYGNGITEARFDLKGWSSPYFRVTVRDANDKRAWTHPIWLDEQA